MLNCAYCVSVLSSGSLHFVEDRLGTLNKVPLMVTYRWVQVDVLFHLGGHAT